MKIQVAFQGGGARLALLLPVVHALRDLDGVTVQITRVAGTSAGAIAAALLAGEANMPALIQHLRGLSQSEIDAAFPNIADLPWHRKLRLLVNLFFRFEPLSPDKGLMDILRNALEAAGIEPDRNIDELGHPCFCMATDLVRHEKTLGRNVSVVQALMESAGLPFLWRTAGDRIDGGLLDNLPVETLLTPESPANEHGGIIAVAFREEAYTASPTSALALAARLLDTAITFKTRATKQMIGAERVFELPTTVGDLSVESFKPDSFLKFVKDANAYERLRSRATEWLKAYVEEVRKRDEAIDGAVPSVVRDEEAEGAKLRALAKAYHQHPTMRVTESILEVIAHGLDERGGGRRDVVRFIDSFKTGSRPLHMYAVRLFAGNASVAEATDLKIFDSRRRPIPFVAFAIPDETEHYNWTLISFLSPLPPTDEVDETYTILHEQQIEDVMAPLKGNRADYLSNQINQVEVADAVEIRLCVPKEFGRLSQEQGSPEVLMTLPVMEDEVSDLSLPYLAGEVRNEVVLGCPAGYDAYVWRSGSCHRGHVVRVVYRRMI
ncbi:patatin-like phospholipase family protein [Methylorubrum extorquens]